MHRHKNAERTAYYRQEASACATAALTSAIAEIKQAYLDLEQGWLCLAPKSSRSDEPDQPPASDGLGVGEMQEQPPQPEHGGQADRKALSLHAIGKQPALPGSG